MKRIQAYLLGSVVRATAMTLVVLAVLSYVLTFMDEVGDAGKGDYGVGDVLLVVATMIPRFLYEAFPVAALIGALLAMGGMANSGELVAMRAAGMSFWQLMGTVFRAGLVLLLGVVLIGDLLGPELERWGQTHRLEKMNKQVTFQSRYGFWVKDGDTIVNIRRATPDGELENVFIYELGPDRRLERLTFARVGFYRQGDWVLEKVTRSRLEEDRVETRRLREVDWKTVVDPAMLSVALIRPDLLPAWELYDYMRSLRKGGQSATEYAIAFWNKVATPITMLAMLLLAVPLVMNVHRAVNPGQRVLVGALVGALFYLASKGFAYGVIVFGLPPFTVALFPLVVFGGAIWVLIRGRLYY